MSDITSAARFQIVRGSTRDPIAHVEYERAQEGCMATPIHLLRCAAFFRRRYVPATEVAPEASARCRWLRPTCFCDSSALALQLVIRTHTCRVCIVEYLSHQHSRRAFSIPNMVRRLFSWSSFDELKKRCLDRMYRLRGVSHRVRFRRWKWFLRELRDGC